MKKNKKDNLTEESVTSEQIQSNVRSYFTKEIIDRISEMSVKQMESLMKDLPSSEYWIAMLKYRSMRVPALDSVLRSTNPQKDPHIISWSQGCMSGLCDMETYVIELNSHKPQEEGDEAEMPAGGKPEGVIIG